MEKGNADLTSQNADLQAQVMALETHPPTDITAICQDGWFSRSATRSGTCSSHGGVALWVTHG